MVSESSLRTAADTISSGLFASLAEKRNFPIHHGWGQEAVCIVVFVLLEGLVDSPQSPCLSAKPVTRNRKVPGSTPPRSKHKANPTPHILYPPLCFDPNSLTT